MKPSDELPPTKKKKANGQVTGLAAELFVAAELLKRGLQTSVTFGNAKSIDLIVYNQNTKKTYTVLVKTERARNAFPITHERVEKTLGFINQLAYVI